MMKTLTIEHLAAYLPYGIKAKLSSIGEFNLDSEYPNPYKGVIGIVESIAFKGNEFSYGELKITDKWSFDFEALNEIEICLRPLSQLTETIEHNGERFVPTEWFEIGDDENDSLEYDHGNIKLIRSLESLAENGICNDVNYLPHGVVAKLISWHFDVNSLIRENLAIPIPSIPQE